MIKKISTFLLLLLCTVAVRAQSIGPATLNSTGGQNTIGGNTYEYSIGEMSMVSTASGTGIIVTQGTLQPNNNTSSIKTISIKDDELKVFPIPASTMVNIQTSFANAGKLNYTLYDASGKKIFTNSNLLNTGNESLKMNIEPYASGNYLLEISFEKQDGSIYFKNFKIQKTQ
jgi:hypothetical protein